MSVQKFNIMYVLINNYYIMYFNYSETTYIGILFSKMSGTNRY